MRSYLMVTMVACLLSAGMAPGCSTTRVKSVLYKGSVVEVEGKRIKIGVGGGASVSVGQTLIVYRMSSANDDGSLDGAGAREVDPALARRVDMGKIRVTRILDAGFAEAEKLKGDVRPFMLVDLNPG